ncbi:MAG: hypothetical protein CSA45_04045 [Gammaproteobacteria bacterium]|nr:MAG: hypothetical protein CSA45_04045 [Gammaproteobacteria bacterium]
MSDRSLADNHPMLNWFIHNPVSANLLMMGILLGGLYMVGFFGLGGMVSKLPLEAFPLIETNTVTVSASLNGSTPEDVETGVTNKIEEALQGVQGVDKMISRSTATVADVSVSAVADYDVGQLLDDVKMRVDSIGSLPAEVEKIIVAKNQRQLSILWVTLWGEASEKSLKVQAERLKRQLLNDPFVETVAIDGEKDAEIAIDIPAQHLEAYGLTLSQVADAINRRSLDLSTGTLATTQGNIGLRIKNQAQQENDYENIVIRALADGSMLRVGDIAVVNDGLVEQDSISEFNGKPSITLKLYSSETANIIEADKSTTAIVNRFKSSLPANLQATIWNNRVIYVRDRINLFVRNAATGVTLVFLLLTMFLNLRLAFWVALGIPVAFSGALFAMGLSGITINIITLFGFIIVLGIVVDDAIIIGESIYTWKKRTNNAPSATLQGTARVSTAATFGVLTTVAAFLPLTQVSGNMGDVLGQIGWVVIFCLLFSLVESKFILPSHLYHTRVALQDEEQTNAWARLQSSVSHGLEILIEKTYLPVLRGALRYRYFSLLVFISLLILTVGTVVGGILKITRFPHIESQAISLTVTMDNSVNVKDTMAWAHKAAQAVRQTDRQIMQESGSNQANVTHVAAFNTSDTRFVVRVGLASADTRTLGAQEIANRWRKNLGRIPGSKTVNFSASQRFSRAAIEIQLLSNNVKKQMQATEVLTQQLLGIDGVEDVFNSEDNVSNEIRIKMKPEANIYGMTEQQLARALRAAFYGVQAQRIQRGTEEVRVMVRYPRSERQSLANLEHFLVQTDNGLSIPIHAVADLFFATSPKTIMHLDKQRVTTVYADVDRAVTSSEEVLATLQQNGILKSVEEQYDIKIRLGGEAEEGARSDASMKVGFMISLAMIYVLLAIPLKSYSKPIIIMSVIPFGVIGAIGGHLLLGMNLTMVGMFGVIALSGVVVNDSLLLLTTIQQHLDEGMTLPQSIETTGLRRFRPIILTSITTFIGITPILFETSFQAQFLIPMAVSLGFGILFATAITLVLVPVLYYVFDDVKRLFSNNKHVS